MPLRHIVPAFVQTSSCTLLNRSRTSSLHIAIEIQFSFRRLPCCILGLWPWSPPLLRVFTVYYTTESCKTLSFPSSSEVHEPAQLRHSARRPEIPGAGKFCQTTILLDARSCFPLYDHQKAEGGFAVNRKYIRHIDGSRESSFNSAQEISLRLDCGRSVSLLRGCDGGDRLRDLPRGADLAQQDRRDAFHKISEPCRAGGVACISGTRITGLRRATQDLWQE